MRADMKVAVGVVIYLLFFYYSHGWMMDDSLHV